MTLEDAVSQFLEFLRYNRNVSPHTLRAYETDLGQFLAAAAGRSGCRPAEVRLAGFSTAAVRHFLAALHERGNSRASASRRLAALRTFARYLVREEAIASDPTALVGAPRTTQSLPAHLGSDDIQRLLEAPDPATVPGRRDRAILELFYASGLRLSELVDLDVESVNLAGRVARVRGKGRKERLVPFNTAASAAIRAMLADRLGLPAVAVARLTPADRHRRRGQPLFLNLRGGRLTTRSVDRIVRRYVRDANIAQLISPHALRHTFATALLRRTGNLELVRRALCHRAVATTSRYLRIEDEELRAALEA